MGTPISFNSGTTANYTAGTFKKATVGLNLASSLSLATNWWNGVDVSSTQYLIYSDIYSQGQSSFASSRPTAWSTPNLNDSSLILLINTLPDRVGQPGFTTVSQAVNWLNQTGKYFLVKTDYENIVTSNLKLNFDVAWPNSYNVLSVCATANENQTLSITAPSGYKFVKVVFASYGTPTGSCGAFAIDTTCHSRTSLSVVEGYLLNQSGTVNIAASNAIFGDPCPGIGKRLYVQALVAPNSISDISGNFITGTLQNGVSFAGLDGGVLVFDGTDDYVNGTLGTSYSAPFTIEIWGKFDTNTRTAYEYLGIFGSSGSNGMASISKIGTQDASADLHGYMYGYFGFSSIAATNLPLKDTEYQQVVLAATTSSPFVKVYKNGVQGVLLSGDTPTAALSINGNFWIGSFQAAAWFLDGNIPIVRFYNKELTQAEVVQNFNAQRYRFGLLNNVTTSGLVNYWDAGSLLCYTGTSTTVRDLSGNGNTSTLVNGTYSSALGGAFIIDASNEGVVTPFSSGNEWTISFFIRRDGNPTSYGRIAGANPIDYGEIAILQNTNNISVNPPIFFGWIDTGVSLTTNEVAHIAAYFSRTSGNIKLWKNGALVYNNTISGADKGAISSYTIGNRADYNGEFTPATYWSTTLYDRQLSTTEVLQNSYGANIVTSDLKLLLDAANPVSYPTTGTVWKDLSTNAKNGDLTNGPTFNTDFGGYFNFDGTDDYVQISSLFNAYPFTVSFWASSDVSWIPPTDSMYELMNMSIGGQRVSLGTTRYNAGNWVAGPCLFYGGTSHWSVSAADAGMGTGFVNVVWVVHGSNNTSHQIYVNGVPQQMYNNGGAHGGTAGWAIASNGVGGEYWDGKISNVTVYSRVLDAIEIQNNFNAYKSRYGL